jgi:hypothetical protein
MPETFPNLSHSLTFPSSLDMPDIQGLSMEEFKQLLAQRIAQLLDRDLNMLMHLLYRIDVHEGDAKRILMLSPPAEIAQDLAELIIQKLLQKLEYRRQYRDQTSTWWNETEIEGLE